MRGQQVALRRGETARKHINFHWTGCIIFTCKRGLGSVMHIIDGQAWASFEISDINLWGGFI